MEAVIDGVTIDANVSAGESYSQVATDFYLAMVSAGVADALLSGSDIIFLNNTTGQEALSVSLTITGPTGGLSGSWIETDVTIAQRDILAEPGIFP